MGESIVLLPELDNVAVNSAAKSLILRITRDLCYECADEVVAAVQYLIAQAPAEIVIEINKVNSVDSSGLRALLNGRNLCEKAGVEFRLDKVSDCVARIINMSGLSGVFGTPQNEIPIDKAKTRVYLESDVWKAYEHVTPSDPSMVASLRDRVAAIAEEAGVDSDTLNDIKIAAGEALANAYKHGSPNKEVNKIRLRCWTCSTAMAIEVWDEGEVFDPDCIPIPDPCKLKDHGMGIYLIRQAMDDVEFMFNCPGNRVRMMKWLPEKKS